MYPERIRRKHRSQQSDSSSNSANDSAPPPLPPIFNEVDIGQGPTIPRPTLQTQSRRPSPTDKQIPPKQRISPNDSAKDGNGAPTVNQTSHNDLSKHDKPDSTDVPSDEYPATISDDYFSQLLEPYGGDHEIADPDHDTGMSRAPHSLLTASS